MKASQRCGCVRLGCPPRVESASPWQPARLCRPACQYVACLPTVRAHCQMPHWLADHSSGDDPAAPLTHPARRARGAGRPHPQLLGGAGGRQVGWPVHPVLRECLPCISLPCISHCTRPLRLTLLCFPAFPCRPDASQVVKALAAYGTLISPTAAARKAARSAQ